MSRYPVNDYPRDRRPSPLRGWNADRRASSYHESNRGGRGRELRDAPPLGNRAPSYRDPRDFSPRDEQPRQRRDSRDGPLSAITYSDPPPFRGGYRGRGGRGDSFRSDRGGRGRFADDRDLFRRGDRSPPERERSPPGRWQRSPDRRDDRFRREDNRWPDRDERDRDIDRGRRLDLTRNDPRPVDAPSTTSAVNVNPERLALITDSTADSRRPSTAVAPPSAIRRESELQPYLSARAETTNNRYGSRASSPPTQPPAVPAFGFTLTPTTPAVEKLPAANETEAPAAQPSPVVPTRNRELDVTAIAPRGPRSAIEPPPTIPRLQNARSNESMAASLTASPTISRPAPIAAPTAPKADRAHSQASTSPRQPFAALNSGPVTAAASLDARSPPLKAPSGPRAHGTSISPEIAFAAAPTAPRADRLSFSGRHADRPAALRAAPQTRPPNWNHWRNPDLAATSVKSDVRQSEGQPSQPEARPERRLSDVRHDDRPDAGHSSQIKAVSAQQSFFGQPSKQVDDDLDAVGLMDDSMSSSEDDELLIEDNVLWEAKHVRQRRELEAKLVDLSAPEYRATTPMENLARLARITFKDIERLRESGMDIEPPEAADSRSIAPAEQSSASDDAAEIPTPTGEDDATVEIEDGEEDIIKRIRRPTPEAIVLPFMLKGSQLELDGHVDSVLDADAENDVTTILAKEDDSLQQEENDLVAQFSAFYQQWLQQCEMLDREREELERIVRQVSEAAPESEAAVVAAIAPVVEGRRSHKFSSELELQEALKQSEETARLEQERHDREAKKFQADLDKEAVIPDQATDRELRRTLFIDDNRLRDPESLTVVFAYEPAPDDFTEDEQAIFAAAYKETPKKWSEIASLLPGREPKHCIRHYYANKWDGRFRDARTRKNKGGRRGRVAKSGRSKGSGAMADMSRAEELAAGPVIMSDSGRPKRAAAPTTFGEKESEAKALLASGTSPAKRAMNTGKDGASDDKPNKRRRGAEKPSRKPKGQPISLAAAPTLSLDGRPQSMAGKDIDRSRLEDASLLAGFHAGRPLQPEHQTMFAAVSESYMHRPMSDQMRGSLQAAQSSAKPSPSSYWSVPEQTDFNKYIKHFGTDFTAIAQHMGTKTHTMIKNHYQRQIDGGNRPDLETDAKAANERRGRGEDLGPPPVPTPITKRKYDQPPPTGGRSLMPLGDAMEIDDGFVGHPKHGSPPQFPVRPQYPSTSAVQPGRFTETTNKPYQPRLSMYGDPRVERPSLSTTSTFMSAPLSATAGQSSRTAQDAQDPAYLQGLRDEQQRALVQGHYQEQERADSYHHRVTVRGLQQSPRAPPALPHQMHGDRKPVLQDPRSNSPPVGYFPPSKTAAPRGFEASRYPPHQYTAAPAALKREESRTSLITAPPPFTQQPPPPEAPKRSNVMSLLNDTLEEAPKRNSLDQPAPPLITRHASPAHHSAYAPPPMIGAQYAQGREPYAQSQYRPGLSGPAVSSSLKQEPLSASASGVPSGLPARSSGHGTLTPPSAQSYDRSGRPFYPQHTMLGHMSTPSRANPSPPPHAGLQHSRTPSMATAELAQRSSFIQSLPPTQPPMYQSSQQYQQAPMSQPPHEQSSAPTSLAPSYGSLSHQRGPSRDDRLNYPLDRDREQRELNFQRERERREWQQQLTREQQQRQFEQEAEARRQQHIRSATDISRYTTDRGFQGRNDSMPLPPQQPPLQPSYASYEQQSASRADGGMREQSRREAMLFTQQQEERDRSYREQRERDQAGDEARRRHDEAYMTTARRTPLGGSGGYGLPGSIPPRR